jgi:hypothetical protein
MGKDSCKTDLNGSDAMVCWDDWIMNAIDDIYTRHKP